MTADVQATFSDYNTHKHFTFSTPTGGRFRCDVGRLLRITADTGYFNHRTVRTIAKHHGSEKGVRRNWVAVVFDQDRANAMTKCLLLNSLADTNLQPPATADITLEIYYSDAEIKRSFFGLARAYLKYQLPQEARHQGQNAGLDGDKAAKPHSIDLFPLFFKPVELPTRNNSSQSLDLVILLQGKRRLNPEQQQLRCHLAVNAGKMVALNAFPGTGKTMENAMLGAWFFFQDKQVLAISPINGLLVDLLKKTAVSILNLVYEQHTHKSIGLSLRSSEQK